MNNIITSKEAILSVSKKIAIETGLNSINMRTVAKRCGVAVGSVYNYFPSKADLIAATVEIFWEDILHLTKQCEHSQSFIGYVEGLFQTICKGSEEYPSFFTFHSMSFAADEKEKGREVMEQHFSLIKSGMIQSLLSDLNVRIGAFNNLPREKYVDFIFSNILSILIKKESSCDFLLEIIRRTIY